MTPPPRCRPGRFPRVQRPLPSSTLRKSPTPRMYNWLARSTARRFDATDFANDRRRVCSFDHATSASPRPPAHSAPPTDTSPCLLLQRVLNLDVRLDAAGGKDRPTESGPDRRKQTAAVGELLQRLALEAGRSGQREPREQVRRCHADPRLAAAVAAPPGECRAGGAAGPTATPAALPRLRRGSANRWSTVRPSGSSAAGRSIRSGGAPIDWPRFAGSEFPIASSPPAPGPRDIQVVGQSRAEPAARQFQRLVLRAKVFLRDRQIVLLAAQLDVVARDLTEQRDQHVATVFFRRGEIAPGRFDRAAHAAEHAISHVASNPA